MTPTWPTRSRHLRRTPARASACTIARNWAWTATIVLAVHGGQGASLVTFAVGALIPLLPYLLGMDNLAVALGLAAVAAFVGGGLVARLTDRPFLRGALRQLILGAAAAGITFLIGDAVGAGVS